MKHLTFALIILLPLFGKAQAHLGATATEIKSNYPEKIFESGITSKGDRYLYTDMDLGTFYFCFDEQTGLTDMCLQIPKNMIALNTQVEIYNKKYVILSETSWKAYLEDGGMINIKLSYSEELKTYMFIYTS